MDTLSKTNLKTLREKLDEQIARTLLSTTDFTYDDAAEMFGVSRSWITTVAKQHGIHRTVGRKPKAVK